MIGQTVAHPLAKPELRSELHEVAASREGVQVVEDARDLIGRPATVIRLEEPARGRIGRPRAGALSEPPRPIVTPPVRTGRR